MDVNRTALVVVDVQNGFVTDVSRPVVPVIADLVSKWQAAGRPVVFTRYLNYPGSPFERIIRWSKLIDPPETDIVPELLAASAKAIVIDKVGYTLFSPEGRAAVERGGWTDLVFCGIATESCVLKSAVDAFEAGITPWVLSDASASHAGSEAHEAGLLVTRRFIGPGQVITVTELAALTHMAEVV